MLVPVTRETVTEMDSSRLENKSSAEPYCTLTSGWTGYSFRQMLLLFYRG